MHLPLLIDNEHIIYPTSGLCVNQNSSCGQKWLGCLLKPWAEFQICHLKPWLKNMQKHLFQTLEIEDFPHCFNYLEMVM
jgi:hypothetical protein